MRIPVTARNTPTYVGTTPGPDFMRLVIEEHPHVCGDNEMRPVRLKIGWGTPPRMWGQLQQSMPGKIAVRNTPTYVGTTALAIANFAVTTEHPHVCGDNGFVHVPELSKTGTPPRMWGQL